MTEMFDDLNIPNFCLLDEIKCNSMHLKYSPKICSDDGFLDVGQVGGVSHLCASYFYL